ncbi:hypothetical protein MTR67_023130 [Solanum verrucosum]|uniref:Reverse transcriptase Ty1/copia-type domain-containing protein n=1 Tax=Solanum verrucosum TaxID=315347 RepID=A0AAF0QZ50_SOLVR|nr:hypothetical protein MTR67_023130 [Solanum verrucosum]
MEKNVIGVIRVFKTKYNADRSMQKQKAILVPKGYSQQQGIDVDENFYQVARFETIRILLALVLQLKWKVYQFDFKSAFLNGDFKEEVYVTQPNSYVEKGKENKVYKLRKALSGLKQAPCAWYSKIDSHLRENGFERKLSPKIRLSVDPQPDLRSVGQVMDSDSYSARNVNGRKSVSWNLFTLGSTAITWSLKKQSITTLSSSNVEYVAATSSTCQVLWMRKLVADLHQEQMGATKNLCDNLSAIAMAKNLVFHGRSKHIDIRHHFIRALV